MLTNQWPTEPGDSHHDHLAMLSRRFDTGQDPVMPPVMDEGAPSLLNYLVDSDGAGDWLELEGRGIVSLEGAVDEVVAHFLITDPANACFFLVRAMKSING